MPNTRNRVGFTMLGGEKVVTRRGSSKPLATAPGKRKCAEPTCVTILSRYNLGLYCCACDRPTDDRLPPPNRRS